MNITILSIDIKTVPTAKGSYQTAEVAFKNNTFGGKVEGKKVVSFGQTANAFTTLATAHPGDTFDVVQEKDPSGKYNMWVSLTKAGMGIPEVAAQTQNNMAAAGGAKIAPKSTYETPEERAQRQVLIVRQSSLNSAIAALTPGAKASLKFEEVTKLARQIEDYVFDRKSPGASGFEDLPDFEIPKIPEIS